MARPSLVPLVKQIRSATRIGLAPAKTVAEAAIAAGLGMPGVHSGTLQQALMHTGIIDNENAVLATEALLRLYPPAHMAGRTVNPYDALRAWLLEADALGEYALVPLPGKHGGKSLTVLDLRMILDQADPEGGR